MNGPKEQHVQRLRVGQEPPRKAGLLWGWSSVVRKRLQTQAGIIQTKLARLETSLSSQSKWVGMESHDLIYTIITYILAPAFWEGYLICIMLTNYINEKR